MNRFDYRLVRQLMLFAEAARAGSITRAAQKLAISPTPVIAQLDELEARVGVKLLNRTKRGVTLTPEGRAVLPTALGLVSQAEAADYAVRLVKNGASGILKIGAVLEAMMADVPQLLERLEETHPNLSVFTEEIDSSEAAKKLSTGEMDLVIGRFVLLPGTDLYTGCLRLEKPVVLLPRGHRLAQESVGKALALGDLSEETWIVPGREKAPRYRQSVEQLFDAAGFEPKVSQTVDSIIRQVAFTACRQGITLIPEGCVSTLPDSVVWREVEGASPVFPLAFAWNQALENPLRDEVVDLMLQDSIEA